ncbi:MAG TPA: DUF2252 domain-containing protein [Acidimicrobiales bacterium]|nr:DUF2252 domain-containing protein [Acidimicrobiales bacterium]
MAQTGEGPPSKVAAGTAPTGHMQVGPDQVVHLRPDERRDLGKGIRPRVPRESHAELETLTTRPDPVSLLEDQARTRVPELVPIRYGRMLDSPFAYYRGAALVMASDLAGTPRTDLTVQACGDAHLSNFGVFGSAERNLVFDLNDFDETLPGPWEWDVKRLAASLAVAARHREFSEREGRSVLLGCVQAYRTAMSQFATMGELDVWYAHLDIDKVMAEMGSNLEPTTRKRTRKALAKARTRDSMQALDSLTHLVNGQRRIISDPPLVVPVEQLFPEMESKELTERMHQLVRAYRRTLQPDRRKLLEQFRFVQLARKVVGVGSVGTRVWIALFAGRDDRDPLFLQAKEAETSVLERFTAKSQYDNQGRRVVAGQHLMQASSDIFLGWERLEGLDGVVRDFYFRQLRDWKGSVDVDRMIPGGMTAYGRLCGWTLARAHARSGDRIAIAGYLGSGATFDRAIADFAERYADRNERDFEALQRAVASGRVQAQQGL